MSEMVTDIKINASADDVWRVLADFSKYPSWNPYVRRVGGTLSSGGTLDVTRLEPDRGENTTTFSVSLYRPGREIRLLDRPMLPGLLDAEYGLKLEPLGPDEMRFVHWQSTSGLLSPIFGGPGDSVHGQLEAMNVALKGMVEHGSPEADTPASSSASDARTSPTDHRANTAAGAERGEPALNRSR
ncbi:MAG: SRPBCC family protein [Chloroflexota bacterium]